MQNSILLPSTCIRVALKSVRVSLKSTLCLDFTRTGSKTVGQNRDKETSPNNSLLDYSQEKGKGAPVGDNYLNPGEKPKPSGNKGFHTRAGSWADDKKGTDADSPVGNAQGRLLHSSWKVIAHPRIMLCVVQYNRHCRCICCLLQCHVRHHAHLPITTCCR